MKKELINLQRCASGLGVPVSWLKEQVKLGRIPCLQVGRKMFFEAGAVRDAIAKLATEHSEQGAAE